MKKIPIAIFMDLSKAIDTIDHEILITEMEYYGIKNVESQWFKSYLSDRTHYVEFNNTQSATEIITTRGASRIYIRTSPFLDLY